MTIELDASGVPNLPASLAWRSPPGLEGRALVHSTLIFWVIEALRPQLIAVVAAGASGNLGTFQLAVHGASRAGLASMTVLGLLQDDKRSAAVLAETRANQKVVRGPLDRFVAQFPSESVDLLIIDGAPDDALVLSLAKEWPTRMSKSSVVLWHDAGNTVIEPVLERFGLAPWNIVTLSHGQGMRLGVIGKAEPALEGVRRAASGGPDLNFVNLLSRLGEAQDAAVQVTSLRRVVGDLAKAKRDLATAQARAKRLDQRLKAHESSLSWRITGPLRSAKAFASRALARLKGTTASPVMAARSGTTKLQAVPKAPEPRKLREFQVPTPLAVEMSIAGWPEHPDNGKPYVIGVMDEFTAKSFGPQLNLIQPRPDNWYGLIEKYPPAFIFIESAWKGNFGSWQFRVAEYTVKPGDEIYHLCQHARAKGIPTIFLNKEDPIHHDKFMGTAAMVDHIFTSDSNMVASYRSRTGNDRVHVLPFAAQPALHKPAPLAGRKDRVCFAGSWYSNRHAERGAGMAWLLRAANDFNLDIYDRNFGTGNFVFPDEFQPAVRGSLPYDQLSEEYRRYRVFLNVNSVTTSPTMFSRRVFELLASGTPVVSVASDGIRNFFGTDAIWLVESEEEAREAIRTLLTDPAEWRRRSLLGIREVFSRHTYMHRLDHILASIGAPDRPVVEPPLILVTEARTPEDVAALIRFAQRQTYRSFQLAIAKPEGALASLVVPNVRIMSSAEARSIVETEVGRSGLVGRIDPQNDYGPDYLRDLVNATFYAPEAIGWAKAIESDCFAANAPAVMDGAIWRAASFDISTGKDQILRRDDLYVIDTDDFRRSPPIGQMRADLQ